jgi:SAM-dependent methyltransferase
MIISRPCPICNSLEFEEIHRHTFILFENHPLSGECITVICSKCGLGFNKNTTNEENYHKYYIELSKYVTFYSPQADSNKFNNLANIFESFNINKNSSILDVGCGGGGFLAQLKNRGYTKLFALDPTPKSIENIGRTLGIEARVGVLADSPYPQASFDVIISTGVLEHLLNPTTDIECMRNLLVDDGLVFVVVPDANRYVDCLTAPFQDFNIEHVNHFSPMTLSSLFKRQGWRKLDIKLEVMAHTPNWNEPVICGLFRAPRQKSKLYLNLKFDRQLGNNLKSYVKLSFELLKKIEQKLRSDLADYQEIILWGVGQTASLLFSQTFLSKFKLQAVIDSNPAYTGRRFAGVLVCSPKIKEEFNGPIVIASIREYKLIKKIIEEKYQLKNKIISLI